MMGAVGPFVTPVLTADPSELCVLLRSVPFGQVD